MSVKKLSLPCSEEDLRSLQAGEPVLLSGTFYTARDAAHKRLKEALDRGEEAPFPIAGQAVYHVGPTPAKPGEPIGSAGPTTAVRMDSYLEMMFEKGMAASIGKGARSTAAAKLHRKYGRVYFTAIGGAGAVLGKRITASEVVAYEDLGTEAVRKLTVEDFPVVVGIDAEGRDAFVLGQAKYEIARA